MRDSSEVALLSGDPDPEKVRAEGQQSQLYISHTSLVTMRECAVSSFRLNHHSQVGYATSASVCSKLQSN